MDGADAVARGGQLGVDGIHLGTALEMEGEMGAGGLVGRTQQSHAIAGFRRLQIGPILRLPSQSQPKGAVKGNGTLHVFDPKGDVA
jgi:hypothetical protein